MYIPLLFRVVHVEEEGYFGDPSLRSEPRVQTRRASILACARAG